MLWHENLSNTLGDSIQVGLAGFNAPSFLACNMSTAGENSSALPGGGAGILETSNLQGFQAHMESVRTRSVLCRASGASTGTPAAVKSGLSMLALLHVPGQKGASFSTDPYPE